MRGNLLGLRLLKYLPKESRPGLKKTKWGQNLDEKVSGGDSQGAGGEKTREK